ncbi:MAG: hypothetical protein FD143_831 [Ignavibacteria bacterium]|nr:MAG: hypothetical protein FD143_831 [Ignavibacteria bacterium]KAF0160583.1 MAG: hypothetical protein FD188_1575 [Ignavibacteria bacterium]
MKRKLKIFFFGAMVLLQVQFINAQSVSDVAGRYVSKLSSSDVLLLIEDGKFVLRESGFTIKGKWDLEDDNEIRFKWSEFGEPLKTRAKAKYKNGRIIDQDGVVWIKNDD